MVVFSQHAIQLISDRDQETRWEVAKSEESIYDIFVLSFSAYVSFFFSWKYYIRTVTLSFCKCVSSLPFLFEIVSVSHCCLSWPWISQCSPGSLWTLDDLLKFWFTDMSHWFLVNVFLVKYSVYLDSFNPPPFFFFETEFD